MRVDLRKEAAASLIEWIAERHGDDVAEWWFWECTPLPIGLPNDKQLKDGLRLACGEISVSCLSEKVHGEIEYEMRLIRKAERGGE